MMTMQNPHMIMMDNHDLEREVRDLRAQLAALEQVVKDLTLRVDAMTFDAQMRRNASRKAR